MLLHLHKFVSNCCHLLVEHVNYSFCRLDKYKDMIKIRAVFV